MQYSNLLKLVGFTIWFKLSSCNGQQCHLQIKENEIVKRLFHGYKLSLTAMTQFSVESFYFCDHLCNSSIPHCLGFSYFHNIGKCSIFNATNLKYHLVQEQNVDTVFILPEYCERDTNGIILWNVAEGRRDLPGLSSDFFHHPLCVESAKGCNDPLCVDGDGNFTMFCKDASCQDYQSGIYTFNISGKQVPIFVEVDEESFAWIHIQRRFDGTVNFFRDWSSYKTGFGDVSHEFWLGNDIIHELTKAGNAMIKFDLYDGNEWRHAEYDYFQIEDETNWYKIHTSGYTGTAGNAVLNGNYFSTYDSDNDKAGDASCASRYEGAWWYGNCHASHLNGRYLNGNTDIYASGMIWYYWKGHHFSLLKTIMKIRFHQYQDIQGED